MSNLYRINKKWYEDDEDSLPQCPICEEGASSFYFDVDGEIVGCDCCISVRDSCEYEAEQDEAARELAEEMRFDDMRNDPDYHNRFENWR